MSFYRFYVLEKSSRIGGVHDLDCDDDFGACRHAARLGSGKLWELWRGREKLVAAR